MTLVLPKSTVHLMEATADNHRHPGLQLDKFSVHGDQSAQKVALTKVCGIPGDPSLLTTLLGRRRDVLSTLPGVTSFSCVTAGPLTLHLARASGLENAGICLHPLYGFAYLPGSGLKGMARAYAETVWLPAEPDQRQAWRQVEDVFGWAPNPDRRKQIGDPNHPAEVRRTDDDDPESPEVKSSCGNIVFHDGWPESWPQLIVDIVNNHHSNYYMPPDDKDEYPPGDWEDPRPVYFLAVSPGASFQFALSKRRSDVTDALLDTARQWLLGALCHLGAGAKTAAGYGAFKPKTEASPPLPKGRWATFETTLELVTPAFLAGANQGEVDCDLRPATLRGLLRWWWRTMHVGFLDAETLRALEAAIWGDTRAGAAVRLEIRTLGAIQPIPVPGKCVQKDGKDRDVLRVDPDFCRENNLESHSDRKTTQGVLYLSFGMDEMPAGRPRERKRRYCILPGAKWSIALTARDGSYRQPNKTPNDEVLRIPADLILAEAKAALWLLCQFGGVGAKARKGFGSVTATEFDGWTRELCEQTASKLREVAGVTSTFREECARSPSLELVPGVVEVPFSRPNVWSVLDQVGFAYQAFAKKYKHQREKMALGLPRRIGQPVQGNFTPTGPVAANGRHASPVHLHLDRQDGGWLIRAVAFPAAHLPDLNTSQAFLERFLEDFDNHLRRRAALQPPSGPTQGRPSRQQASSPSREPSLPRSGEPVEAVLLDERTRKGGWRARHAATGIAGPIQNTNDVPADKKPGQTVTLIVQSANEREISFRFPTAPTAGEPKKKGRK